MHLTKNNEDITFRIKLVLRHPLEINILIFLTFTILKNVFVPTLTMYIPTDKNYGSMHQTFQIK